MPKKTYQNPIIKEPVSLCIRCNKTFANLYSLRRHMALIHDAPRTLVEVGKDGVRRGKPVW